MSTVVIPTSSSLDHYSQQVTLDGVTYILEFAWNRRAERWFMSISDGEGPIATGMKVVADRPLLTYVSNTRRPPGELMALDTSGGEIDPGLHDLGDRVLLMYREVE
jgi:hypothetical protein